MCREWKEINHIDINKKARKGNRKKNFNLLQSDRFSFKEFSDSFSSIVQLLVLLFESGNYKIKVKRKEETQDL